METPKNEIFGHKISAQYTTTPHQIVSAKLYRFHLPLKDPLKLKNISLDHREGMILSLRDAVGNIGLSEISPLPGFSEETLETAAYKTTKLLGEIVNSEDFTNRLLSRACEKNKLENPSLAYFGVETALLALLASQNQVSLGTLLYGESSEEISLNGLINQNLSEWMPEAERLVSAGYKTLKIKVGRINAELESMGIKGVRQAVGPNVKLRLDANRSWDLETAISFGKSLAVSDIEYIEEPVPNPNDLPRFFDACGMHFALDETLHHIVDPGISFSTYTGLSALVLKPTLIACMPRFLSLVAQAKAKGVSAVLSSSYESDVGISILAQLAASISGTGTAVGLDTGVAFRENISARTPHVHDGKMKISQLTLDELKLDRCELIYES